MHFDRRQEYLEKQLLIQIQTERLLGYVLRLNFVVERLRNDPSLKGWPTRALLLAFHDYVFGDKKIPGVPQMDILVAVGVLKEFDSASEEQLLLTPSEGSGCLVATFAELSFALEEAYQELLFRSYKQ